MEPVIEIVAPKKLIGKRLQMNLNSNKTPELWKSFMPRCDEIINKLTTNFISMQVYDPLLDIKDLDMETLVNKWATVEVIDFNSIPDGMETYELTGGLYAVFHFKGNISAAPDFFRSVFYSWIPDAGYQVDNTRAHFEILGEKYKNGDPNSEEDVYIPIKVKV